MLVAVSQRVDRFDSRSEVRDALDQKLVSFLLEAQLTAVPVPNVLGDQLLSWLSRLQPDGIVLSGGNDIGQELLRDETESCLLNYAIDNDLPVLGICRGMQFLAVENGASLKRITGHVATRTVLNNETGFDYPKEVNCYHNEAVSECPKDYLVTSTSEDGVIKGIRHKQYPWEGWMWHPERETEFNPKDLKRVQFLFGHLSKDY